MLLAAGACDESPYPHITTSTPTTVSTARPGTGIVSGALVGNQDRQPIAGAQLRANGTTLLTNANGEFQLTGLPEGSVQVELSGAGLVTRVTNLGVSGTRTNVTLDVIRDAAPFDLSFYRQFARDGTANPAALESLKPWTVAPSFYMRTVTDDTGEAIAPDVLAGVRRVVMNSVPELSAGRFSVAAFETGSDARAFQQGWVNVTFFRTFPTSGAIGDANVGGNIGQIRLAYDAARLEPRIDCDRWIVAVADHEIVHTMGFYHTGGSLDAVFNSVGCTGTGRAERTRYHAAVMYSRPRLNRDPDRDPETVFLATSGDRMPMVVSCTAADVQRR
jgi:hypothetical protein